MEIVITGTAISILFAWAYDKFDKILDRSEFARFVRHAFWQKSTDARNLRTYGQIIHDYAKSVHADTIDLPYVANFLNHVKDGSKILDYGCGSGELTVTLSQRGFQAAGSDISNEFISLAKASHPELEFLTADSKNLVKDGRKFDAIIAAYSIIHLQPIMTSHVLSDFKRILSKDGYLYLSLQGSASEDAESVYGGEGAYYPVPYRPELELFLQLFTPQQVKLELREAGFELIDIQHREPVENEFPFRKMFVIAKSFDEKLPSPY